MQITFNPKAMELGEAATVMGMALPAFITGCRRQGDTLAEVQAGIAELVDQTWAGLSRDNEGKA
jgi:hypothetical protein